MTEEELLGEVEDILRTAPSRSAVIEHNPSRSAVIEHNEDNAVWLGRVSNFIEEWRGSAKSASLALSINTLLNHNHKRFMRKRGWEEILILLHQARYNLRMKTIGPVNTAIGQGAVFDYFDELRKLIETATQDLLFVDPYLDAEFVSRYLSHVKPGVSIRLLTGKLVPKLLPAVKLFVQQFDVAVEVRSAPGFHDRYMLVDQNACYQSGASFKDGAKKAPTTLTQITDAFPAVLQTYKDIWDQAKVEWPQEQARRDAEIAAHEREI